MDLAPWQGLGPRGPPALLPTALPLPLLGDQIPPGWRPPGHIRSSVGTSWGSCSAFARPPPWEPELGQAPEDGRGKGPAESGPVSEEGRARGARPRAAESGVQRVRCRDCCGHPRTCHSAVAFFRVTPCAPHRFGTPTSHPGEVPGSAPWAAEGGVRRQGPSFLSREDSGGGSPRRSQAPSPGAQGPYRPSPPLRLVPQTEGRVQGGASGAGRSCLRMQTPGPLTDSGLPLHRPPPAPPLQRLLLQANPPSRSQTPGLGQERGHWELPRSQSTLQTPPAVTGPCACAAVSERSLLRRGLSQGPALGQAWCRDVRPGEHLLGSLGRCRRAQTPGGEGRGQTKGVGRKRGCRQSDLTGVGSKSPPGRVVVGGQAQACHFFS